MPPFAAAYSCYDTLQCRSAFQSTHSNCPGMFCGRPLSPNGDEVWSDKCGACPWGTRTDGFACVPCGSSLDLYGILYLLFFVFGVACFQAFFIDKKPISPRSKLVLHCSAIVEQCLAIIFTLIILPPSGTLRVFACQRNSIMEEWYTGFHNPGDYHCASEAVVPLYTAPIIFMVLCIALCLVFRVALSAKLLGSDGTFSIFSCVIGIPVLLLLHVILGGVIFYSYPYILLVICLLSTTHTINRVGLRMVSKFRTNPRPMVIWTCAYIYSAFAVASIAAYFADAWHWYTFLMIIMLPFVPSFFQVVTYRFTDPRRFNL